MNSGSNFSLKKRIINNFTKTFRKSTNNCNTNLVGTKFGRYEAARAYNGLQQKNKKAHNRGITTIDNSNAFTSTYNRILNNLCAKNKTPNKRENKNEKKNLIPFV